MDSEVLIDADKISKDKSTCVNLVYTRRPKKPKTTTVITPVEAVGSTVTEPVIEPEPVNGNHETLISDNNDPSSSDQSQHHENGVLEPKTTVTTTPVEAVLSLGTVPVIEPEPANDNHETLVTDNTNDVSSSRSQSQHHENGVVLSKQQQEPLVSFVDERVKICLNGSTTKPEINDLKGRLEQELEQVRVLYQKLEMKENEIEMTRQQEIQQQQQTVVVDPAPVVYNHHHHLDHVYQQQPTQQSPTLLHYHTPVTTFDRRSFSRVSSDTGRFRHLTVSVTDNDYFEKEKRTPKANHLYPNSDFLLAKDRLPPESNKRPKPSTGLERHKNQVFRSCSNLLQRLMKHKHGWVFNEPVNAKLLGLHDYHDFIKRPMDLGTIKSRLAQNFYKVPSEFAEDVRLTFTNAMTYNPRGHDVYVMAEQLSNIFEEKWGVIESDWNYGPVQHHNHHHNHSQNHGYNHSQNQGYNHSQNHGYNHSQNDGYNLSQNQVYNHSQNHSYNHNFLNPVRTLDRSQSVILPKPMTYTPIVRTPVPKKPKARDPNKRDMTFEEKQKLSANLQSLPSEKLDSIVQIIKKSNTLSQNDEEIEVDIDSVDVETLWELDRFVMNYRKNLSKVKRRAEIQQERALAGNNMVQNPGAGVTVPDAPKENRADEQGPAPTAVNQGENRGDNASRSSSSSSSSSDSSSSDSDSDSSSEDGSDHRV